MDEVLMQLPSPPASQQVCNPPRLTYRVEAVSLPSHLASTTEHLDCKIEVKGAVGAKGVTPYFKVYSKSTSPTHTSKGEVLVSCVYTREFCVVCAKTCANPSAFRSTHSFKHCGVHVAWYKSCILVCKRSW